MASRADGLVLCSVRMRWLIELDLPSSTLTGRERLRHEEHPHTRPWWLLVGERGSCGAATAAIDPGMRSRGSSRGRRFVQWQAGGSEAGSAAEGAPSPPIQCNTRLRCTGGTNRDERLDVTVAYCSMRGSEVSEDRDLGVTPSRGTCRFSRGTDGSRQSPPRPVARPVTLFATTKRGSPTLGATCLLLPNV
jgi:hypothetical protein